MIGGIEQIQAYNEFLKRKLLADYQEGVIDALPQPTMFGGKRMRNFVLPASTEYDYPSSLSVGHLGSSQPDMLGGSFWDDFGKGFKQGFTSVMQPVGDFVLPIAKDVATDYAKDALKSAITGQGRRRKKGGVLVPSSGLIRSNAVPEYMTGAGIYDDFTGVGGSKNSAFIAKMIGSKNNAFKINKVKKPSGNLISYAQKEFNEKYKGKKPSDMYNVYKGANDSDEGEGSESDEEQPAPVVKKSRKKNYAQGTADIRNFFGSGHPCSGGDILKDLGKVGQAVAPFLPLMMGMGRGDVMPPHPCGGNWADDLGKISKAVQPFAPLLMGLGRGKMPSKYALNKILKGGNWLDDLGKVSKSIEPFIPLLMGAGGACSGGNFFDDLGKVSKSVAPFVPLLMGMGKCKGGNIFDDIGKVSKAVTPFIPLMMGMGASRRKTPMVGQNGHGILPPPDNVTPSFGMPMGRDGRGVKPKGGAMIMNHPDQYSINTGMMPLALKSYNPPLERKVGGRKQLPQSGKKRESARGAIVSEIMRKKGLSLGEASKYVKVNGLY